jgi:tRNA1(Val) A37 N6-methylase TrmN6
MLGVAIHNNINYIGFDTNKNLKKPYDKIIKLLKLNNKVKIIFRDSSKINYKKYTYDMVITSPPYYNIELYPYMKKLKKEEWLNNFLIPMINNSYNNLSKGGHYILNIPIILYEIVKNIIGVADKKIKLKNKEYIYIWYKIKE